MPRPALFLSVAALLLIPPASRAQELLSFEAGGQAACSKAIDMPLPDKADAPATLAFAMKCDGRDLGLEKLEFDSLSKSVERGSPEGRLAFNVLMVSFAAYRDSHVANEVCKAASGCDELKEHAKAVLNHDFLTMAEGGTSGTPVVSTHDFSKDDCMLNAAYQAVLASLSTRCDSSDPHCLLSDSSFRENQRAWVRYRDAWATFGPIRWPPVPADSWSDTVTRQRTEQMVKSFGVSVPDECVANTDLPAAKSPDSNKK